MEQSLNNYSLASLLPEKEGNIYMFIDYIDIDIGKGFREDRIEWKC